MFYFPLEPKLDNLIGLALKNHNCLKFSFFFFQVNIALTNTDEVRVFLKKNRLSP